MVQRHGTRTVCQIIAALVVMTTACANDPSGSGTEPSSTSFDAPTDVTSAATASTAAVTPTSTSSPATVDVRTASTQALAPSSEPDEHDGVPSSNTAENASNDPALSGSETPDAEPTAVIDSATVPDATTTTSAVPPASSSSSSPSSAPSPPVLPADPNEPLRVAVYGDSIGSEIFPYLAFFANADREVTFDRNVFGGTNACDWFAEAERDARRFDPDVVITVFVGNDFTSCARASGQDQTAVEVAWKTVADTNALASFFADDVPVYRVGYARGVRQQRRIDESGIGNRVDVIRYLLATSSTDRLRYVDGSEALLENGRYSKTLPCSVFDADNCGDDGRIRVRAVDGVHLCPTVSRSRSGVISTCAVHSSGAARLAAHVLTPILSRTS